MDVETKIPILKVMKLTQCLNIRTLRSGDKGIRTPDPLLAKQWSSLLNHMTVT